MNATAPKPAASAQAAESPLDRTLVTAFLDHIPDFVYFKDRESRFIAVSRSKLHRNGLKDAREIVGKTDFDFFSAEAALRTKTDEAEVMRTGVPIEDRLEHVKWGDGRETWSLSNKMPLRDGQGAIIGTFGITRDITASKAMEAALEHSRRELTDASRRAGMAEIATGVLHNVGNVLTSLNVSTGVIAAGLRQSKTDSLARVAGLLRECHVVSAARPGDDSREKLIPEFIGSLARHFDEERTRLIREIESLQRNVDHIKEIVSMQQTYASVVGAIEPVDPAGLMEDALRMTSAALARHHVHVIREFDATRPVLAERGKVLQILVNLIGNANHAAQNGSEPERIVTLRVAPGATGRIQLSVADNGVGIPAENLDRIFNHGFTTKATGHGFGLHSAANAAREMKGRLTACSGGLEQGAIFTLDLPASPV